MEVHVTPQTAKLNDVAGTSGRTCEASRVIAPPGVATNMRAWAAESSNYCRPWPLVICATSMMTRRESCSSLERPTWSALPAEAHAHQARTLAEYRRFADTLSVLIREIPDDRLAKFRDDTAL